MGGLWDTHLSLFNSGSSRALVWRGDSFLAAVAHVLSCGCCCFSGQHHLDVGDSGPDVHGLAVSWGARVRSCKGSAATLQCVAHDSSYPALVSLPSPFYRHRAGWGWLLGLWLVTVKRVLSPLSKLCRRVSAPVLGCCLYICPSQLFYVPELPELSEGFKKSSIPMSHLQRF